MSVAEGGEVVCERTYSVIMQLEKGAPYFDWKFKQCGCGNKVQSTRIGALQVDVLLPHGLYTCIDGKMSEILRVT